MAKKGKASILILVLLINGVGCHSYIQINREDTEKIVEGDKVKITTIDENVYILTNVTIEKSRVKGFIFHK